MLPSFLKPSYRQYKDDTDRFVTWLVNMAEKKCGVQPQMAAADDKSQKYVTTVNQLLKFGNAVARSTVQVPATILARAKRAVELRKDVTAYHVGKRAHDRGHSHFNAVLEELCTMLEPKTWKTTVEKKPVPASVADEDEGHDATAATLMNRFAALDVEDLQDPPEDEKDFIAVEVVNREKKVKAESDADALEWVSEAWFKFQCLFHDLHEWRSFISQMWTEYRDQKIDLMTASVVTDNALQLARDLVQEALQGWPKEMSDAERPMGLQEVAYEIACIERGLWPLQYNEAVAANEELAQVIDFFFLSPVAMLRALIEVINLGTPPIYKKGHFGTYDAKAERTNMSFQERMNEDTGILAELFPDFFLLVEMDLPVTDEITNGFVEFWRTKKPSLWLSFATQILLDIHHVMRTSRMNAWDDLRMCGKRNVKIIDDFFKLSATHPTPTFWSEGFNKEIRDIRDCITTVIEKDPFEDSRELATRCFKKVQRARAREEVRDKSDHFLFTQNSVLCGLTMLHINMRMQRMGQQLASRWQDMQQMAFLYNLVQRSPGKSLTWPDIELFIRIHGEEFVFIGERPRDAQQSLNWLQLVTGISSLGRFARDHRGSRELFHRPDGKRGRMLEPTNKVGELFRGRYGDGEKNTRVICSTNFETLLNELDEDLKKPGPGAKTHARARVGRKTAHEMGPLQLLAVLKTKLCEEEPILMFNYFGMHERCMELLRIIHRKEDAKFRQSFTDHYMPDETFIANLVVLVHHVACGSAMVPQQLRIPLNGCQTGSRIVASCGDVMRDYFRAKGNAACRELEVFCRNKGHVKALVSAGHQYEDKAEPGVCVNIGDFIGPAAVASLTTGIPVAQPRVAQAKPKSKTVTTKSGKK